MDTGLTGPEAKLVVACTSWLGVGDVRPTGSIDSACLGGSEVAASDIPDPGNSPPKSVKESMPRLEAVV